MEGDEMSALRLDPRTNGDRLYQYKEYQVIAARFARRRPAPWWKRLLLGQRFDERMERRAPKAIRLLPYKIAMGSGLAVFMASIGMYAWLSAETAQISYERQELQKKVQGMEQARSAAVESNLADQSAVLNGTTPNTGVVYPAQTDYVVLTNVPDANGKRLVEELYPLSKELVKVDP
jgi:hypothetical protein